MERKFFHGNIQPVDIAQALLAEFNQGNLRAQTLGASDKLIVQVSTSPNASSGGQTALTVTIQSGEDGVIVEAGQQAWLGVAASLGASALSAIRNPFSLFGRLDDIAQDLENLQLVEKVWKVIEQAVKTSGASTQLSERLRRVTCEFCHTANPVGEPACLACGAPLGMAQPNACPHCGFVVTKHERICPNCKEKL
ncbi:MAG: zinc ribbon domain-containing protein [Anaerolineales bacterium]|nr:zinc ribbon domain-containing protein [Anaerolineales bacterium]MCZ2120783.1 zinc ribbon domain-containing protein [Anaerolineales bacterium]